MVKEAWDSFKDNIKERISNPFLGTFTLVWIVHNWKIVYAFFYFDKDWKLQTKIDYFNKYWTDHNFFWNLICVAFIAVGILVITYVFLALSRFLTNYFENVIIPIIQKISKGKIVTAEEYQKALDKINILMALVESERNAKNEAIEAKRELNEKATVISETKESNSFDNSFNEIVLNYIKSHYNIAEFEKVMLKISKNERFEKNIANAITDFLILRGIIEIKERSIESIYYDFTKIGKEFKNWLYNTDNFSKSDKEN